MSFTHAPEKHPADKEYRESATDSGCRRESANDTEPAVHRLQFVTLAFDRPQTVLDLPSWRWPLIGPYNGFSGVERIRGWQLLRFYELNGWLRYPEVCSVTGRRGGVVLHNEDYSRPWDALPVSRRAHLLIHTRARYPKAWARFLAQEALPGSWATALSPDGGLAAHERLVAFDLLQDAPHPAWVIVPAVQFLSPRGRTSRRHPPAEHGELC